MAQHGMDLSLPIVSTSNSTFTINLDGLDSMSGSPPPSTTPRILQLSSSDIHLFTDDISPPTTSPRGFPGQEFGPRRVMVSVSGGTAFECDVETLLQFPCTLLAISVREQLKRGTSDRIVLDGLSDSTFALLLRYLDDHRHRRVTKFTIEECVQLLPAAMQLGFQELADHILTNYLDKDLATAVAKAGGIPGQRLSTGSTTVLSTSPSGRPNAGFLGFPPR